MLFLKVALTIMSGLFCFLLFILANRSEFDKGEMKNGRNKEKSSK